MLVPPSRPLGARALAWIPFVASAACAAFVVRLVLYKPSAAALSAALVLLLLAPALFARRRLRRLLGSGDVRLVMAAWSPNLSRLPYPETMAPLIAAAAFAACGWAERARGALAHSVRGPAWQAALEHRLFVETLLDTFEGDRAAALSKSSQLLALPLPAGGPFMQSRVRALRDATAAFARAFAHVSRPGDLAVLERASRTSPLVHWAMRYAAAVAAIDAGAPARAKKLLAGAPAWARGCVFHDFHSELAAVVGLTPGAARSADP